MALHAQLPGFCLEQAAVWRRMGPVTGCTLSGIYRGMNIGLEKFLLLFLMTGVAQFSNGNLQEIRLTASMRIVTPVALDL